MCHGEDSTLFLEGQISRDFFIGFFCLQFATVGIIFAIWVDVWGGFHYATREGSGR